MRAPLVPPPPVLLDRGCATMEADGEAIGHAGVKVGEAAQPGPVVAPRAGRG